MKRTRAIDNEVMDREDNTLFTAGNADSPDSPGLPLSAGRLAGDLGSGPDSISGGADSSLPAGGAMVCGGQAETKEEPADACGQYPDNPQADAPCTAPRNISEAMSRVMMELPAVKKDKKTAGSGKTYQYRGIDDIYKALHPLLARNGVVMLPYVLSYKSGEAPYNRWRNILTLKVVFQHSSGTSLECVSIGESVTADDKGYGICFSYAMKNALIHAFCIPCENMPDENGYDTSRYASLEDARKGRELGSKTNGIAAADVMTQGQTDRELADWEVMITDDNKREWVRNELNQILNKYFNGKATRMIADIEGFLGTTIPEPKHLRLAPGDVLAYIEVKTSNVWQPRLVNKARAYPDF